MTYCLGILLPAGLVLASDSRSNAGVDQVARVCKLATFVTTGSGVDGSTFPHGTQALESVALVRQAHLSPVRVLQADTMTNAEVLGWQDRIGSLDKGKFADLIAVPGDPLADITQLQKVDFVMKGGKVIRDDRR